MCNENDHQKKKVRKAPHYNVMQLASVAEYETLSLNFGTSDLDADRYFFTIATPTTNSLSKCTAYFPQLFGLRGSRVETERSNVYLISPLKFYSAGILGTPMLFTMLALRSCVSVFPVQFDTKAMRKSNASNIITR